MNILLVDDSSAQQKISKFYLEHVYGHKVTTAASGVEGIDTALSIMPDLIILDTCMPDMSGKDTLRVIKKIKHMRGIPVIMAGTERDVPDKDQLLAMGAADFILKHQNMDILNGKINSLRECCTQSA